MKDDFEFDDLSDESKITNKDRFYNILWYIPFLNIAVLRAEKQWEKDISKKFTRQWLTLFLLYIWIFILFAIFFGWWMLAFLTLIYFLTILFFSIKAYNWIYVEISFLDKIANFATQETKDTKKEIKKTTDDKKDSKNKDMFDDFK